MFGDHDPTQYAAEAQERWGGTDTYKESMRRTSSYAKQDWLRIKAEASENEHRLAAALDAGLSPDSAEAMDVAEAHRQHISRWFYDCPYEMHKALADMYVADQRFTAHYEDVAPGLAHYVHDAVHANAERPR